MFQILPQLSLLTEEGNGRSRFLLSFANRSLHTKKKQIFPPDLLELLYRVNFGNRSYHHFFGKRSFATDLLGFPLRHNDMLEYAPNDNANICSHILDPLIKNCADGFQVWCWVIGWWVRESWGAIISRWSRKHSDPLIRFQLPGHAFQKCSLLCIF